MNENIAINIKVSDSWKTLYCNRKCVDIYIDNYTGSSIEIDRIEIITKNYVINISKDTIGINCYIPAEGVNSINNDKIYRILSLNRCPLDMFYIRIHTDNRYYESNKISLKSNLQF